MNPERMSSEEERRAMESMTTEQAEASAIRQRFFRQPKEALELREPELTPEGDRLPPTPEQVAEMDLRLQKLQEIMGDTKINWQIDGGLGISVYEGDYIGFHKDIDISLEESEVAELQHRAVEHGYGLFMGELYDDEKGEVQFAVRPASLEQFKSLRHHHFLIRTNEEGKIQNGGDLDFIDVHPRPRNESGREYGTTSVPMPEAWDATTTVDFHGAKLNLPSLAKVAYFKLCANRPVDHADLRTIARSDSFTPAQLQELETMLVTERADKLESMRRTVDAAAIEWRPDLTQAEMERFFLEDDGNWTLVYGVESRRKFGTMFFAAAQTDLETAKEQIVNAVANTLPHEREDRVEEMKEIIRGK